MDAALRRHVGVEDEVDDPIIERDRLPVGERRLATLRVRAPPVPDPDDVDAAEAGRGGGIGLPDALGHE